MVTDIVQKFTELYGSKPEIFRSPGRVNLIGEHTDYNNGFVLPAAINKEIYFALSENTIGRTRIYSYDLEEYVEFDLKKIHPVENHWQNYLLGVLAQFEKQGHVIDNFDLVFGGNVPIGAGVSSSAAVECGLAYGLNEINGLNIDKFTLAKMAQKAEHEYAKVMSGIMDQFANLFGKAGHVVKLDCRSLDYQYYPFHLSDYLIVLCDTKVKHSLASSEYNNRRKECEEGVRLLSRHDSTIESLRDVTPEFLEQHMTELPTNVYKRCLYVVNEIRRVEEACVDLEKNDLIAFGQKMYDTHRGLQLDYEVSCAELDFLVEQTVSNDSVIGARMMGGGFGGCTINLVKKDSVESFTAHMSKAYQAQFNVKLETYVTQIVDGTGRLVLND